MYRADKCCGGYLVSIARNDTIKNMGNWELVAAPGKLCFSLRFTAVVGIMTVYDMRGHVSHDAIIY